MRLHALENGIEVVGIDLDEFPLLQLGQRFVGLAGEISQNAHDKGQFLEFDGAAGFHVVGDMDTRGTDAIQFVLCTTFLWHKKQSSWSTRRGQTTGALRLN